jgi:hypothetical protein
MPQCLYSAAALLMSAEEYPRSVWLDGVVPPNLCQTRSFSVQYAAGTLARSDSRTTHRLTCPWLLISKLPFSTSTCKKVKSVGGGLYRRPMG